MRSGLSFQHECSLNTFFLFPNYYNNNNNNLGTHRPTTATNNIDHDTLTIDSKSNPRMATMLHYTYRANMVFFADFAACYLLRGSQEDDQVATMDGRMEEKE
jgi:hypothetical protein